MFTVVMMTTTTRPAIPRQRRKIFRPNCLVACCELFSLSFSLLAREPVLEVRFVVFISCHSVFLVADLGIAIATKAKAGPRKNASCGGVVALDNRNVVGAFDEMGECFHCICSSFDHFLSATSVLLSSAFNFNAIGLRTGSRMKF